MKYWSNLCAVLLIILASRGFGRKHSKKGHVAHKETKKQGVPGLMESAGNLGAGTGGMNGMGGMGDLSMGFGAGATSIGEGGGATMEGMPTMPGGPMELPGTMNGPAAMQIPGGMEGSPMAMPMGGGPGGGAEPGLMSKQIIEGPEGGMGGGMNAMAGMTGMGGMGGMAGMTGMGGMTGMTGMTGMGGMGGMPGMAGMGGMGGGIVGMNMEGGIPSMGAIGNSGGPAGAMFGAPQEMTQVSSPLGASMSNALQGAIGGNMAAAAQKREKMGKIHKIFSKLSKRKDIKKHHHKH